MFLLTIIIFISIFPEISSAYIDPGTGGMIGSSFSVIGVILTSIFSFLLAYVITPFWKHILKPLWNYKKTVIAVIIVLALSAALFLGFKYFSKFFMESFFDNDNKKVIVLGIDGFDPDAVDFLMSAGKLPNFEMLKNSGTFGRLKTIEPPISPVVWTTMSTGVNPGKHNIFDFMWFDRQKYLPYLSVLEQDNSFLGMKFIQPVKANSFWDSVSGQNIPVSVIHWPVTFPPQAVNGNNLSGLGAPDIRGFLNGYARYTNESAGEDSYGADRVIFAEVSGNQVYSEFQGPFKANGDIITEPFAVKILDGDNAVISVQGKDIDLKKGQWSDWINVKFKQGFGKNISAIFKVYPESLGERFDMFATSMQFDPENPATPISSPENYSNKLSNEIGKFYTLGMPEDAKAVNDLNLSESAFLKQVDEIRIEREKMFWTEFNNLMAKEKGVLAVVFDETDRAEHILFGKEAVFENGKIKSVGDNLEKIYTDKDKFVGEILNALPKGAALLIVSDHGFKPFTRAINLNNWLLENGYLVLKSGFSKENAGSLFKNVDWNKTRAYSYGYVSVNINLKGREKNGIVSAGEKDGLENEIIAKLGDFIDPENDRKIVSKVFKKGQIYSGVNLDNAADLIVGFNVPFRIDWESPIGGFSEFSVVDNVRPWQADHIFSSDFVPGIFFSNFKIKRNPGVLDIAPTVLDLLDIEKPVDYDGRSLLE